MAQYSKNVTLTVATIASFIVVSLISISRYDTMSRLIEQRRSVQQLSREWFLVRKFTNDIGYTASPAEILTQWRGSRSTLGELIAAIRISYDQTDFKLEYRTERERFRHLERRWAVISSLLNQMDGLVRADARGRIPHGVWDEPTQYAVLLEEFQTEAMIFEDWIHEAFTQLDRYLFNQVLAIEYLYVAFLVILTAVLLLGLTTSRYGLQRERMYLSALNSIGEGCLITDGSSKILFSNRRARELLGLEPDKDLTNRYFRQLLAQKTSAPAVGTEPSVPASESDRHGASAPLLPDIPASLLKMPPDRTVHLTNDPLENARGRETGTVYIMNDVSQLLKLQNELSRRKWIEDTGEMVVRIVHDLNNSLMTALGNLELALLSSGMSETESIFLRESKRAVLACGTLASRLMSASSVERQLRTVVPLRELIAKAAEAISGSPRLHVALAPEQRQEPFVEAEVQKLQEAFELVLRTAAESMGWRGTIKISIEAAGVRDRRQYCRVSIRDAETGAGGERLSRVFESLSGTAFDARGLDLAIALSRIQQHHGSLRVEQDTGGNVVSIYLPGTDASGEPQSSAAPAETRACTVLLLDSEKGLREVGKRMLERLGHTAVTAHSGEEAIGLFRRALLERRPFDAAILDLTLPDGIDGIETLRELRKLDPQIQAIVTSGYTGDPVLTRYAEFGFDGALAKPYELERLNSVLASVVSASPGVIRHSEPRYR